MIDTPFHEVFSTPESDREHGEGRFRSAASARPKSAPTVIAFLCSDAASYIVGETIEINGGQLMR